MLRLMIAAAIALALASPAEARRSRHHVPWCGLYMMQVKHKTDRRLARAIEWAHEGSAAFGPCVGCVVVWRHHVGEIVGGPNGAGEWLVHSGSDGNAVRTRYRSLRGVIAYRRM